MTHEQTVNADLEFAGAVTSGMQDAHKFISKSGYLEQFIDRLGYEPFPGTLNIEFNEGSGQIHSMLDEIDPILIEEWSDGEKTFGAVLCYPVNMEPELGDRRADQCHIIVPRRTDHGRDVGEIIAPEKLREELDLADGDQVKLHVHEP